MNELVVDNSQFRDLTRNLRRHTCNLHSHSPVACPRPSVVLVPSDECDQHRNDCDPGCSWPAQQKPRGSQGAASAPPPCCFFFGGGDDGLFVWRPPRSLPRGVAELTGLTSRCVTR